jgi:uncharacterized protein (DUF488 family)
MTISIERVAAPTIFTLGHSTRPIDEFLRLLTGHSVQLLGDIRTIPRSRRNPQFEQRALAASLESEGIEYRHMPELGGLRKPKPDSINTAWRNASFRGYADYMQTVAFEQGVDSLVSAAAVRIVAVMCAESLPWRCHRSLLADALLARGVDVREIVTSTTSRPHRLTGWARVADGRVTYPGVV